MVTRLKMKDFMMTILPGEFWVAEIPFTGDVGSKKRPMLVLWLDRQYVIHALFRHRSFDQICDHFTRHQGIFHPFSAG